tara:strand:- start:1166 stop:1867 length:702 start_codon:yes stop_codon:yes gene_type:complete
MIKNYLFSIFFFTGIFLICIIFLPSLFLPQSIVLFGGKMMGFWAGICLKIFMSTKIIIKGKENIIRNEKFFIASSHQSMFETFFLQTIFNSPIFILKKELIKIPIFGWYLKKIGSVSIDRNKISKENLGFSDEISSIINKTDRPLIIFPQGTRLLPEDRSSFKKGVGRIYENLNIKCQPVAINSGRVWPKKGRLIPHKELTISILKPLNSGLEKNIFLKNLEQNIYMELDNIN